MPCTTLLAGKNATYDGSTFAARNEDSGSGSFCAKKMTVVLPQDQPRHYRSVLSHVEMDLPDDPMRYTCMPNAVGNEGIWGAAGVNSANVSMTATETLTTNARVLGADPFVVLREAENGRPEQPGGIGEEDMVSITLPYIRSAREGVLRLGSLLEKYGTYEMNGIAFQDADEVWWLETIGGHHWIARRVPDDCYVVMPNQFGIDFFDLEDAFGAQKEFLCSTDLREFIRDNFLDLTLNGETFNARLAFGSHSDADHTYNTPRAWFVQRYFNPAENIWDGPDAEYRPDSDDISWCRVPEHKITVEDVKYVLSSHYQGTPYDPYSKHADPRVKGSLRPIGINRNNFLSLVQIRPYLPEEIRSIEWVAYGSNAFNAFVPLYGNISRAPSYFATEGRVTTENFYWENRVIAALADACFDKCIQYIERYQMEIAAEGYAVIHAADRRYLAAPDPENAQKANEAANAEMEKFLRKETDGLLDRVLSVASMNMKNAFSREDG
ncbi:MAG: C69 family dipeptidase [Lachnospiraceae bacterium]|jgi:dipeptidase